MEEELAEAKQETSALFEQKVALASELNELKREHAIKESTAGLTAQLTAKPTAEPTAQTTAQPTAELTAESTA